MVQRHAAQLRNPQMARAGRSLRKRVGPDHRGGGLLDPEAACAKHRLARHGGPMRAYPFSAGVRGSRRGFTLAELTVWLVLFSLVSSTILATMILSMRTWSGAMDRVRVHQNVRLSMDALSAELRQG